MQISFDFFDHAHEALIGSTRVERSPQLVHSIMEVAIVSAQPFIDVCVQSPQVVDAIFQLTKTFLIVFDNCSLPSNQFL